ncbi:ribosyldihydronicotinamide dehydrogenase [quinone]-like isoform X2 [Fundulus heteroclitus]|uniref:ribosyldihydronicotinamide dehydrogenase [quinone]-like isoform X2 n=1 Tax=Fundulus heteroclitus TaxID=8078 RepID=UPI00165B4FFD|nr:ribosyldihydronicotinamide dehydrogenase [quinone]-like isoform X2 [Fundulus heteroclitus]
MAKKVLIVYAHQSSGSFNAAAKNAAVEVLTAQGCTVDVSDLYAMGFKATATAEDIKGEVKNAENFCYLEESKLAWEQGKLSADIMEEQSKLTEADLIIFQVLLDISDLFLSAPCCTNSSLPLQFPMYWFSVPAILKGWIDRVLTNGFAFSQEKRYSQGIFKDKKAMLSFTTGSLESMFSPTGINGDMNVTLWPLQNGILHYCGFQVLAPQIFWAPSSALAEDRKSMLESWRTRLQGLLEEKPLSFISLDCFDDKAFQLKPEVHEKHASKEFGLTVGIHLNKPLPPHSQMKAGC